MKQDLKGAVEAVSQFMGHNLTPSAVELICEQTSFDSMKGNTAVNYSWNEVTEGSQPFFRKGIVGDWKNHFSEEQSARLDAEYTTRLAGTGLDFRF